MKISAIIPARGGSKRLKKKNIYPIWRQPMIFWAIKACQESKYDIDVWVSSESDEVLEISKSFGVNIHRRDTKLADDITYKQVVVRNTAKFIEDNVGKSDIYLSLQANSPTITSDQIDLGIDTLLKYEKDEIISVDDNLMQNAAFRVFRGDYVFQEDLSTNCGVVIAPAMDIHTLDDIKLMKENKNG